MLGQEPDLHFVGADQLADNQVGSAVVAGIIGLAGRLMGLFENGLVGLQQPRDLHGRFLATAGRTRQASRFRNVGGHRDTDPAQHLYALGQGIDQFGLRFEMFVEQ